MESTATLKSPEFPSLAGLDASYIEQGLRPFGQRQPRRLTTAYWLFNHAESKKIAASNSPEALANMVGIAHALTPQEIKEAAAWYSAQKPSPLPGTPPISAWEYDIQNCKRKHQAKANGQGHSA